MSRIADYNLGRARGTIEFVYNDKGERQAKQGLGNLEKSSMSTEDAIRKTSTAFVAAGAAIVGGLALAVNTAANFEERISAIGAVSGATGDELDAMREKALQLGADTKFSALEAAVAMEELAKAGLSTDDILNGAADAAVNLAAAGEVDLPRAAEIASNAMNVFRLTGEDMPHVADLIAGAANASAISVDEFGASLAQSGAAAALAGVSFDDLSVAIALMGNAGIKGSDAGTSLKTMLLNLNPTTDKQIKLMKELGIVTEDGSNAFFDAQGNAKSLGDIAGVLQGALQGMTKQQQLATLETLFGSDAIRAASVLALEGAAGFDEMATSMGKISAADVASKRMDNLKGDIEQLKGSLETAAIVLGSIFLPALRSIAQAFTGFINMFTKLPEGVQKIIAFATLAAGALLLFVGVLAKVVLAIKAVAPVIMVLGHALKVLMANPVFIVIAALIALVAAIIWAWNNFKPFRDIVTQIGTLLANFFGPILQNLVNVFNTVVAAVIRFGGTLMRIWNDIWTVVGPLVRAIGNLISSVFQLWWAIVEPILNIYWHVVQFVWDRVLAIIRGALGIMIPIITTALNVAWKIFQAIWNVIVGVLRVAWAIILGIIRVGVAVATGIINTIRKWIDTARTVINNVKNAIKTGIDAVIKFFRDLPGKVLGFITGLGRSLYTAGKNMVQSLIDGVKSLIGRVTQPFKDAAGAIANLWPFSPAKEGPLRKHPMDKAGANLVRDLAAGIASQRRKAIDAMGDVALAMPITLSGASVPPELPARRRDDRPPMPPPYPAAPLIGQQNVYNPIAEPASQTAARQATRFAQLGR